VTTRTFGTSEEAARAGQRIRRMHARLRGHDRDTGAQFRIEEPELLLWVHWGQIDSHVDIGRRAGILTSHRADSYVSESRRPAAVVGIRAEDAPASAA
jgi:uncharacterized protein (DUF2236 family)